MRAIAFLWIIQLVSFLGSPAQAAGDAPAIVIPGRAGVPVIINGGDASFCVVEGDWGLARPGMPVTVVACPPQRPIPSYELPYFPAQGHRPGYGRLEVKPPPDRELPKPAESYHRQWESQSAPVPPSGGEPPANVDVTVVPEIERRWLPRQNRKLQD
jgi:hypothetical protein